MTRIIFLDVDGPMIPVKAYYMANQTKPASMFDPCAVGMLNRLLSFSGAKLVISSIWRLDGRERCVELLRSNGVDPAHLHEDWATPRKMSSARYHEIKWWLDKHPEVERYVAIDDEDLDVEFVPSAVLCDAVEGFSFRNYLECCVHLDAYEHPDTDTVEKFTEQIRYYKRREIWRTSRSTEPGHHLAWAAADQLFPAVLPKEGDI